MFITLNYINNVLKTLIEVQRDAWVKFKQVNENRLDTIEENMREFKNWILKKTSPGGSISGFHATSFTQERALLSKDVRRLNCSGVG